MTTNPLENPVVPPANEPEKRESGKRITCDYCKCSLTSSGDVLKMSDTAKEFRDASDIIERFKSQLESAKAELEAEKAKRIPEPAPSATEVPTVASRKPFGKN